MRDHQLCFGCGRINSLRSGMFGKLTIMISANQGFPLLFHSRGKAGVTSEETQEKFVLLFLRLVWRDLAMHQGCILSLVMCPRGVLNPFLNYNDRRLKVIWKIKER